MCSLSACCNLKRNSISCTGTTLFGESFIHSRDNLLWINDSLHKEDWACSSITERAFWKLFSIDSLLNCGVPSRMLKWMDAGTEKKKPDQWSWFERTVDFSFRRRWRQSFSLSSQHPLNASTLEVKWNGDLQVKVEQFTRKWNSVIIYSPICWWNIVSSFVVHKTFLEPHSKTALLQHSPKQMKLMKTLIKQ